LRRVARVYLERERPDHTLQPTALVHEAWMRLARYRTDHDLDEREWLMLASQVMRRVLTDHARARGAGKRDGGRRVVLDEEFGEETAEGRGASAGPAAGPADDGAALVLEVDDALGDLSALDPDLAALVELRFFGGHSMPEIATLTGCSLRTVNRRWSLARAWLASALEQEGRSPHGR
jgi:RNA polymerase sigma factor (TIGR02999 family)